MTADKVTQIVGALTRDFNIAADERDARREIDRQEVAVLAEQRFALELMESNRAVYFDGPAGTGKSFLMVQAAIEAIKRGEKTLLTCWNVVMAERLRVEANVLNGPLWATDLGSVMLRVAGLSAHPEDADDDWYQRQLPQAALSALADHPKRGGYRNVVVEEFQDVAGNPLLVEVLLALAAPDARFMLAGDDRQQVMRPTIEWVNPFAVAREQIPDLVSVRIRRNCRQAPSLVSAIEGIVGRPFGASGYRLPRGTSGGADRMGVTPGREVQMLVGVLKLLVRQYGAEGVVVLSPWGSHSTAALSLEGASADGADSADLRWLRANLGGGRGQVRFGSIAKMKGIESDAVVITDIGPEARAWVEGKGLDWGDLLYVALSRARYRAVVLEEAEEHPASASI